jgi:hypothetical protein
MRFQEIPTQKMVMRGLPELMGARPSARPRA